MPFKCTNIPLNHLRHRLVFIYDYRINDFSQRVCTYSVHPMCTTFTVRDVLSGFGLPLSNLYLYSSHAIQLFYECDSSLPLDVITRLWNTVDNIPDNLVVLCPLPVGRHRMFLYHYIFIFGIEIFIQKTD